MKKTYSMKNSFDRKKFRSVVARKFLPHANELSAMVRPVGSKRDSIKKTSGRACKTV
jgi:hypothetical protein